MLVAGGSRPLRPPMTQGETCRPWDSHTVFGAALGTAPVEFAVLLALFLRDVVLSGNPSTMDSREGLAGVVLELRLNRALGAARRVW